MRIQGIHEFCNAHVIVFIFIDYEMFCFVCFASKTTQPSSLQHRIVTAFGVTGPLDTVHETHVEKLQPSV